jgi:hypothetical protein
MVPNAQAQPTDKPKAWPVGWSALLGDMPPLPDGPLPVVLLLHLVANGSGPPGVDLEFALELPDGSVNKLGATLRIIGEENTHGMGPGVKAFIGWDRKVGLGSKAEPVNGVFFDVRRVKTLSAFLSDLSGHLAAMVNHELLSPNNN